jgi:transposase-like protein
MDQAKADAILEAMQEGTSLGKAAKAQGISRGTFLRWVDADDTLADQYTRARTRMLDVQAEELEAIGEAAAVAKSQTKVAGLRLQSDNRKWLLSKLAPKKYGERLDLSHSGSLTVSRHELSDAELEAIAAGSSAGAAGTTKSEGES